MEEQTQDIVKIDVAEIDIFNLQNDLIPNFRNICLIGGDTSLKSRMTQNIIDTFEIGNIQYINKLDDDLLYQMLEQDTKRQTNEDEKPIKLAIFTEECTSDKRFFNSNLIIEMIFIGLSEHGYQNIFLFDEENFPKQVDIISQMDYFFIFPTYNVGEIHQIYFEKYFTYQEMTDRVMYNLEANECLVIDREKNVCRYYPIPTVIKLSEMLQNENENEEETDETNNNYIKFLWNILLPCFPCFPVC